MYDDTRSRTKVDHKETYTKPNSRDVVKELTCEISVHGNRP